MREGLNQRTIFGTLSAFVVLLSSESAVLAEALALQHVSEAEGFGLTSTPLMDAIDPTDALAILRPQLNACQLRVRQHRDSEQHEVYDLHCHDVVVYNAWLARHRHGNKISMINFHLPEQPPPDLDARRYQVHSGSVVGPAGSVEPPTLVWWVDIDGSWNLTYRLRLPKQDVLQDVEDSHVIATVPRVFHAARVFAEGPKDRATIFVDLPHLDDSGYLDGSFISVHLASADERVRSVEQNFLFLPDQPDDSLAFDQVQTYHHANRAVDYFAHLGFRQGEVIPVTIDALIGGRPDNAQYIPQPGGPAIILGRGDASLYNLARDSDVVVHEYAHHIIYRTLQSTLGESGILHEGKADYFAYALNEDPYLGESLLPAAAFLRTADLPGHIRYDNPDVSRNRYTLGQVWSSVLWQLRAALGEGTDAIVYRSIDYLGPSSGFQDAILALLNADRDLFPREPTDALYDVFGQNHCTILIATVGRGFASFMEKIDGSSCQLDLKKLANKSRDRLDGSLSEDFHGPESPLDLVGCGTIRSSSHRPDRFLSLFLIPIAFGVFSTRRSRHES